MHLETYTKAIEFSEKHRSFAEELANLAKCILLKENQPSLSAKAKENSISGNILKDINENEFVDNETLYFFYVLYFLIQKQPFLKFDSDWYNLFLNAFHPQHNFYSKTIGYNFLDLLLIGSNRYFNVNVPQIVIDSNETEARLLRHSYFGVFSLLKSNVESLANALFVATDDIKAEDNYLELNQLIKEKSLESIEFGRYIIGNAKSNIEKLNLFFPHAFVGITTSIGIDKSFTIVEELLKSENDEVKKIGLRSIAMLHGNHDNPREIEVLLLPILEEIELTQNDSLLGQLIFLYGLLIDKLSTAKEKLISIANNYSGKDIFFALATIISIKIKEKVNEEWIANSLLRLSNLSQHYVGTYAAVSRALYVIVESHVDIVLTYFTNFINENGNEIDDLDAFKNLFFKLSQQRVDVLNKLITVWFNDENYRFHRAAAKILDIMHTDKSEIQLDKTELDKLQPFDIEFILYKVVGNVFSKEHLQKLVYSALSYSGEMSFITQVVTELFCHYITYNYPGSLDYLKQEKENANEHQKQVIETIEIFFEDVYAVRKEKPKEVQPSHERLQILFNQSTKNFKTLEDKSKFREASILDFVSKVSIKTGNTFFSRDEFSFGMKNRYSNKSKMGHISRSFEFPGGEFLDPIGQEYNRYIWRICKRRSK